jgi:D-sedoheptulose 7-phosphate isomerase
MRDIKSWKKEKLEELGVLQKLIINMEMDRIEILGKVVVNTLKKGNKLAFLGNGGSAAESMHLAAEFVSKCNYEHRPLNAISLNESQSAITAISNDYGFEFIFERLVEAELKRGDILIALSTSGKSPNVLRAISKALHLGVAVYLWTGPNKVEIKGINVWNCPIQSTPRVQEIHLIWGHLLAEYVELYFE